MAAATRWNCCIPRLVWSQTRKGYGKSVYLCLVQGRAGAYIWSCHSPSQLALHEAPGAVPPSHRGGRCTPAETVVLKQVGPKIQKKLWRSSMNLKGFEEHYSRVNLEQCQLHPFPLAMVPNTVARGKRQLCHLSGQTCTILVLGNNDGSFLISLCCQNQGQRSDPMDLHICEMVRKESKS